MMNLYYYEGVVNYYFFEDQDGKMEVISQNPERIENLVIHKDNRYIGQIRYFFRDYQPIVQKADKKLIAISRKKFFAVIGMIMTDVSHFALIYRKTRNNIKW